MVTVHMLKYKEFERSRKVLNGKAIELRRTEMRKRPRKSDPFTVAGFYLG